MTRNQADLQDQEWEPFIRLLQRIAPRTRLLRAWPPTGGVSAQITALEIERPDGPAEKLVVRQHGEVDRLQNPQIARDEFRLLQIAQAHGLAAPRPIYVDDACDIFPTPLVVIEFIEGETVFEPPDLAVYLRQLATELARIHSIKDSSELTFLPKQGNGFGNRPPTLDDSLSEGRIRNALEAAWPVSQANASVLLHGDYWPGNVLWNDGELAAVIDWEDARTGDPLSDLGNARLEILMALGHDAMHEFTRQYTSRVSIDLENLPYWELVAALRLCGKLSEWGLQPPVEASMRERHTWFVGRAVEGVMGDVGRGPSPS